MILSTLIACLFVFFSKPVLGNMQRVQPSNLATQRFNGSIYQYKDNPVPIGTVIDSTNVPQKRYFFKLTYNAVPGFLYLPDSSNSNSDPAKNSKCIFILNNGFDLGKTGLIDIEKPFHRVEDIMDYVEKHPESANTLKKGIPMVPYTHVGINPLGIHSLVYSHPQVIQNYVKLKNLEYESYLLNLPDKNIYMNQSNSAEIKKHYMTQVVHNHYLLEFIRKYPALLNNPKFDPILMELVEDLTKIELIRGSGGMGSHTFTSFFDKTVRNNLTMNLYITTMVQAIYRKEGQFNLLLPKPTKSNEQYSADQDRMESTYVRMFNGLFEALFREYRKRLSNPLNDRQITDKIEAALEKANAAIKALPEATFGDFPEFHNRAYKSFVEKIKRPRLEFFFWFNTYDSEIYEFIMDYCAIVETLLTHFKTLFVKKSIDDFTITKQMVLSVWKYYDPTLVPSRVTYMPLFESTGRLLI